LANSKTQNAFLFTVNAIFLHDYPLAVEPGSTPKPLVQKKLGEIDMLLSAVSVLVAAQSSSEIPEGLMNNPVFYRPTLILSSNLRPSSRWSLFFRSTDQNPGRIFLLLHSCHKRRQLRSPPPPSPD